MQQFLDQIIVQGEEMVTKYREKKIKIKFIESKLIIIKRIIFMIIVKLKIP